MTQSEIISAITALSATIKANVGHGLGDDDVIMMANEKLKILIPMLQIESSLTEFLKETRK